ncbi:hypothetical protein GLYMA_20G061650v4 [Glycine max]|nr:hypothetical protein GLYMA_20G061650v4 [Glycine max]KAH1034800.1 hypothetical protein GYH30_054971 [Glycine max]
MIILSCALISLKFYSSLIHCDQKAHYQQVACS